MRRHDFEFLLDLLRENAGWEFDETKYFIIDKSLVDMVNFVSFSIVLSPSFKSKHHLHI